MIIRLLIIIIMPIIHNNFKMLLVVLTRPLTQKSILVIHFWATTHHLINNVTNQEAVERSWTLGCLIDTLVQQHPWTTARCLWECEVFVGVRDCGKAFWFSLNAVHFCEPFT